MQSTIHTSAKEAETNAAADGAVQSSLLQRAEEFIRANLRTTFSLLDLTEATGTSPSTLLRTFNTQHGMSPMQYVRKLRLEAVRHNLLAAEPRNGAVSVAAFEFGFRQLGRFSAQYRETFGELPSVTLRRDRLYDRE